MFTNSITIIAHYSVKIIGSVSNITSFHLVSCLVGFYSQGPRKEILRSSKAHVSLPTLIFQRPGRPDCSQTGTVVSCLEGWHNKGLCNKQPILSFQPVCPNTGSKSIHDVYPRQKHWSSVFKLLIYQRPVS